MNSVSITGVITKKPEGFSNIQGSSVPICTILTIECTQSGNDLSDGSTLILTFQVRVQCTGELAASAFKLRPGSIITAHGALVPGTAEGSPLEVYAVRITI